LLFCALAVACSAESTGAAGDLPTGSYDGLWQGDGVAFTVRAGVVQDLVIDAQSCDGEGCTGKAGGAIKGSFAIGVGLTIKTAAAELEGTFDGFKMVAGTWSLTSDNGCCKVIGAWSASWTAPLPGSSSGASSSGATSGGSSSGSSSGASSGGVIGSKDWDGESLGDVHPGPERAAPGHTDDAELSKQQNAALSELNELRALVGLPAITQNRLIAKAAQAHAQFYVQHYSKYKAKNLSPHKEDASFGEGFTGVSFGTRLKKAGFSGPPGAEVMAFTGSPSGALKGWLETVYHRLPLIDPRVSEMGFGIASSAKARTEVMNTSNGGKSTGAPIVVYPVPGQKGVPRSWSGNEGPQPPKPKSGYPSGPVITARTPTAVKWLTHELLGPDDKPIQHVWLTPANDKVLGNFDARTVVVYADQPLASGLRYTVHLTFEDKGEPRALKWRFTTK